jgi:hypothetical protein
MTSPEDISFPLPTMNPIFLPSGDEEFSEESPHSFTDGFEKVVTEGRREKCI